MLRDWTSSLLRANYILRPVITISGVYHMSCSCILFGSYYYFAFSQIASQIDITNLAKLNNNTYFIDHMKR